MNDTTAADDLTVIDAIKDFGWLPWTFALLIGGPSALSLMQSVFVDYQLIRALQWVLDGYHQLTAVVGGLFERPLGMVLSAINARLGWSLSIGMHWRPIFLLAMVFVAGLTRGMLRDAGTDKAQRATAWRLAVWTTFGALIGSLLSGLVPLQGAWWTQGLLAAMPVVLLPLSLALAIPKEQIAPGQSAIVPLAVAGLGFGALAFVVAAGLSRVPSLESAAGVITLVGLLASYAIIIFTVAGLHQNDRTWTRVGLSIGGGIFCAALIAAADFAIAHAADVAQ